MVKKTLGKLYLVVMLLMLYIPMLVLVLCSFNAEPRNKVVWGGFSLKGYTRLFQDETVVHALVITLALAGLAAAISTVLGTMACVAIARMKRRHRLVILGITNIPLLNADIVTGISLMLLFVRFVELNFWTMLIAHITMVIPYVILSVLPKMQQANASTYEAALDLGASPVYAFFKVTLHEIMPGILSGFLLAFTMSMDDFSITYFTKAPGIHTLSTMINAEYRKGIHTEMYALSTILFVIILFVLFLSNRLSAPQNEKQQRV